MLNLTTFASIPTCYRCLLWASFGPYGGILKHIIAKIWNCSTWRYDPTIQVKDFEFLKILGDTGAWSKCSVTEIELEVWNAGGTRISSDTYVQSSKFGKHKESLPMIFRDFYQMWKVIGPTMVTPLIKELSYIVLIMLDNALENTVSNINRVIQISQL